MRNETVPRGYRTHEPVRCAQERNELMLANQALIYWALGRLPWAVRRLGRDLALDLAQEALLRVCDLWEEARGALSTVAFLAIRRKLQAECRRVSRVKAPGQLPLTDLFENPADDRIDLLGRQDPDHAALREAQERAEALLCRVPRREREVLRLRVLEGRTLQECSQRLGVTKQRCQQLQQSGLARLRVAAGVARPGDLKRLTRHKAKYNARQKKGGSQ